MYYDIIEQSSHVSKEDEEEGSVSSSYMENLPDRLCIDCKYI